jgi:hypothetical protein
LFHWRAHIRPGVSVAFTDAEAGNLALHVGDDPVEVGSAARNMDLVTAIGVAPE